MRYSFLAILCLALCLSGLQAVTVSTEDFEGGAAGWNNNTTETHANFSRFLGRFAGTGGAQGYYKSYALAGALNQVTIQFDFYRIDSWDAENFLVYINNENVSTQTYVGSGTQPTLPSYIQALTPVQEMGYATTAGWYEQKLRYTFTFLTSLNTVTLGFGSNLSSGIADESWGVDNIIITREAVPELSSLWLCALGVVFFKLYRQR